MQQVEATDRPAKTIEFRIHLTARQSEAWRLLHDDSVDEVLYGGSKGSGKSLFGCAWCYLRAQEIIQEFGLQPRKYPLLVGFMGRKRGIDFVKTTLETWKKLIPPEAYTIREQAREIVIANTVKIGFGGLDSPEVVEQFNSAEHAFFFIDQAEEITRDDVAALRASLRMSIAVRRGPEWERRKPKYKALYTANPAPCWLRDEFVHGQDPRKRFVKALPSDNPYLPPDYIRRLKDTYRHRPELIQAYVYGSWDDFSAADQVIRAEWVDHAKELTIHWDYPIPRLITCDPARFGDDETVIYGLEGTEIVLSEIYGQKDTMYTANRLWTLAHRWDDCLIVIDSVGIGGGIADRLVEMGANVLQVNSAARASNPNRYYNLRAEMWDLAAEMFAQGDVQLRNQEPVLVGQLTAPKYEYRGSRMLIEDKEQIKERLGRSPDRADAYVMGLYGYLYLVKDRRLRLSEGVKRHEPPKRTVSPPPKSMAWRIEQRRRKEMEAKAW